MNSSLAPLKTLRAGDEERYICRELKCSPAGYDSNRFKNRSFSERIAIPSFNCATRQRDSTKVCDHDHSDTTVIQCCRQRTAKL
ncbi:hypothetical protein TNCV_937601 [Trichonephila clavipes]|nr:hypothetical protein TNCV_937601 [Trichonephila clavipes]